jgi:hypothetical protein
MQILLNQEQKMAKRKITKKQLTARVNINLLKRIDNYIDEMDRQGLSIRKIDIIEKALFEYMNKIEKEENENKSRDDS